MRHEHVFTMILHEGSEALYVGLSPLGSVDVHRTPLTLLCEHLSRILGAAVHPQVRFQFRDGFVQLWQVRLV